MEELTTAVWTAEGLVAATRPVLLVGPPVRRTRGYINYAQIPYRIVVRRDGERTLMRSTLLHELAHAVHRLHSTDKRSCRCGTRCIWDGHGAQFKTHLARLEHHFSPGTHSRWGIAGCRGLTRVPAGTPWHADIPCLSPPALVGGGASASPGRRNRAASPRQR